jgi:hypothetical protein
MERVVGMQEGPGIVPGQLGYVELELGREWVEVEPLETHVADWEWAVAGSQVPEEDEGFLL